jgi:hypothetical protein
MVAAGGQAVQLDAVYGETCGSCHYLYPPYLLPGGSWHIIIKKLPDHFGESLELDASTENAVAEYLLSNAAEKSSLKTASKIMGSLGKGTPERVTEVPYIQHKHQKKVPQGKSIADCGSCHKSTAGGFHKP